ncbi:MAG: LuxR C-terminal-related transcriptional regulator [Anaerolineae bacterium]
MMDADNQNPLTDRQMEVLELVAQGVTNKEIGRTLHISEHTVRKHLQNIFEKLQVSSRTEATTLAYQRGWVILPGPTPAANSPAIETLVEGIPAPRMRIDHRLLVTAGIVGVAVVALVVWMVIIRQPTPPNPDPNVVALDLDRWNEAPPLSTPRMGLAVTAFKGHLYAIAGETPAGPTWLTERLDPNDGVWRRLADKPTPVRDVGAAVLSEKIYVPGGCLGDSSPIDVLEVYDPDTDTWSEKASMPKAVCRYTIVALEGNLYVFGGWDGKSYTNDTLVYDPDEDVWSAASPMPTARGYAGAAAIEGQIYVVGGYDGRRDLAVVEAYAPSNDQDGGKPWTRHAPLPDGRAGAGVVTIQSRLYIVGGGWEAGRDIAIQYNVRSDTWTPFANPTTELWRNMGVAALDTRSDTRIYAIGGWDGDYVATNRAYTALYNVQLPLQQR